MLDFYKLDVGCRIFKVGCRMTPISFRIKLLFSFYAMRLRLIYARVRLVDYLLVENEGE